MTEGRGGQMSLPTCFLIETLPVCDSTVCTHPRKVLHVSLYLSQNHTLCDLKNDSQIQVQL